MGSGWGLGRVWVGSGLEMGMVWVGSGYGLGGVWVGSGYGLGGGLGVVWGGGSGGWSGGQQPPRRVGKHFFKQSELTKHNKNTNWNGWLVGICLCHWWLGLLLHETTMSLLLVLVFSVCSQP